MLKTEMRNPRTKHFDRMETVDMLKVMNDENMNAVRAVGDSIDDVARAVDAVSDAFAKGGHHAGRAIAGFAGENDSWANIPTHIGITNEVRPFRSAADSGDCQLDLHLTGTGRGDLC